MSQDDKLTAGSCEEAVYCSNRQGTITLSQLMQPDSQSQEAILTDTGHISQFSNGVSTRPSVEYEFFDKEEQKRREEYRNRVEKHYCRLIEEERLSPESASFLSDAFAEAEVRAKFGTGGQKSKAKPEYHTGIDKTVWREVDHQRSKSLERLKSQHIDNVTDNTRDKSSTATVNLLLNMDTPGESLHASGDCTHLATDSASGLESSGYLDSGQFNLSLGRSDFEFCGDGNGERNIYSSVMEETSEDQASTGCTEGGHNTKALPVNRYDYENNKGTIALEKGLKVEIEDYGGDVINNGDEGEKRDDESLDSNDLGSRNYGDGEESSETLTLESEEENTNSEDEFDFNASDQREWVNKRGGMAVEKSMEAWLGSSRAGVEGGGDNDYYKDQMKQYKEKLAAKARGRMTKMLKQNSSLPSASPTPVDYDADEEVSYKEDMQSSTHSLDHWSDSQVEFEVENRSEKPPVSGKCTQTYDFIKPMSSRSSVSSERNRVDHDTYQSYTAGLLHSSGKSEKFLKLQKHFAVLERITALEERARLQGAQGGQEESEDLSLDPELYAKYDVQSQEELDWLYQELNEARKNEEFFYDLQRLAVYQWKPSKDFGLKRKGKSLNDLRKVYEHADESAENDSPLSKSFFHSAMEAEKQKHMDKTNQPTSTDSNWKTSQTKQMMTSNPNLKPSQRPLYGTNIPERLDDFEIIVEAKKQMNKKENENLHVRSVSTPYTDFFEENMSPCHRRSDSSKGSLFSKPPNADQTVKKPKPTVAEVTPVPRQGKQRSPRRPKITSGPHDFASRINDTEAVARPMQSNLQIYNSLENPQYQATVTFDEGIPARKLSRGRSNENFMIQKDADGNFIVVSADKSPNRTGQGSMETNKSLRSLCSSADIVPKEFHEQFRENNQVRHQTNLREKSLDEPDHGSISKPVSLLQGPDTVVESRNLPDLSRHPIPPPRRNFPKKPICPRHSGVDKTPVASVKSAVKTFEHRQDGNDESHKSSLSSGTRVVPDLLADQSIPQKENYNMSEHSTDKHNIAGYQKMDISMSEASEYSSLPPLPPPREHLTVKQPQNTGIPTQPTFKVRDLRSLAKNNEFCQSNFFPQRMRLNSGDSSSSGYQNMLDPTLHRPVVARIFRKSDEDIHKGMQNAGYDVDKRRHSTSSTDTFIVKESEDEVELPPLNVTYTKENFTYARSKSEPDLCESDQPLRPRSAKSSADLAHSSTSQQSGRHCIPRTVSGNLDEMYRKYNSGFHSDDRISQDNNQIRYQTCVEVSSPIDWKQDTYDSYMPPEEIVKDMMKSQELYRNAEPKEKPRTPSDVSQMTLDYLQEIGEEWNTSKTKQKSNQHSYPRAEIVQLPRVENFVGSDTGTSPNRWEPVLETKPSTVVNKIETSTHPTVPDYIPADDNAPQTFGTVLRHPERSLSPEDWKYYTLPRKPKSQGTRRTDCTYTTIPRMRPDKLTNKARDGQNHTSIGKILYCTFR